MASECSAAPPPSGLRLAYEMRDFLTPPGVSEADETPSPALSQVDLNDIEYIDSAESDPEEGSEGRAETTVAAETAERGRDAAEAACRLRRWRPVSRRARGPRAPHESDCGLAMSSGGISASAGELLSLAPPLLALTAPSSPCSPGALPVPSLAHQANTDYFGSSPECFPESLSPPPGPRYKLAGETSLQVCCYQHTRTVMDKILSSKFLRRWETHTLTLQQECITSKTPSGLLEKPLELSKMQEVYCISRWDPARKFCLRIVMPNGSLLIQASNAYTRDQWYHSIIWRKNMLKYQQSLGPIIGKERNDKEFILKELKNMVDFVMTSPLHDETVSNTPLHLVTELLVESESTSWSEEVVSACAPLLAERGAPAELCAVLARLCRRRSRAAPPPAALAPPVRRVLKRNVDFARAPHARRLVSDYISALNGDGSGAALVRRFVEVAHGPSEAACPHPRAAPNLASVALAALNDAYREPSPARTDGVCFAEVLLHMSEYPDWLLVVGGVLQPVPLPSAALRDPEVATRLSGVLHKLAKDQRCAAHSCLAPPRTSRSNPPSWLKMASPTEPMLALPHQQLCQLWGDMLGSLLSCCFRRKSFLQELTKQLPDFLVVALTEHPAALEALCLMLEWKVVSGEQTGLEIVSTLQGTPAGERHYALLCQRQQHLQLLQATGGPKRLALPVKATDEDVVRLLAAGSFGNLECLSLAFTSVTSACAYQLIKLPTLRYLNLWATQFGDAGVQLIAEHLPRLQVLNLCETPVSDKGIEALAALPNLRRLNLNSTKLSAEAFQDLKQRLPNLQEFDVRYTEAW